MGDGFRAAQAFVEVSADIDEARTLAAARRAASQVDGEMKRGVRDTGKGVAGLIGDGVVKGVPKIGAVVASRLDTEMKRGAEGTGKAVGGLIEDGIAKVAPAVGTRTAKKLVGGITKEAKAPALAAGKEVAGLIGDGVTKAAPRIGVAASGGLMASLAEGIAAGGPTLGMALLAAAPLIVGVASSLGAMISAALVSGLGLAAMGGGIALALKDPQIQAAASKTGDSIMEILTGAAVPFRGELLKAFTLGEAAMKHWEPQLKRIFSVAATFLEPLTKGLVGMVDKMLPGMTKAIEAIQPAIGAIGIGLTWVGREIGYMFKDLSDNGPELVMGIAMAFGAVVVAIRVASVVLNALTETFGWLMEQAFKMGPILQSMGTYLQAMGGPMGALGAKMVGFGDAINEGKAGWDGLKNKMAETVSADGAGKLTDRQIVLNQSMREGVKAAGSLAEYFRILNGTALGLEEAESRYQASLDAVSTSIKENGKTTDVHTAKGRANLQVLRDIKTASEQKAQAAYDDAVATGNVVGAEKNAKAAYEAGRAQLIKARMAMGESRAEATAYANKIMKIPKNWSTSVNIATESATKKLDTFIKKVKQADGTVANVTVRVTTKGDHYIPGVGTQLKAAGGAITGGSGYRDDVPVLAMGGEWMIKKSARHALERTFGRGIMDRLNNWDTGRVPVRPDRVDPMVTGIGGVNRNAVSTDPPAPPIPSTGPRSSYHFAPGAFTVDVSRIKDVADLVRLVQNLTQTARAMGAAA